MKVRLVGYTQPSEEFMNDFDTPKDLIAFCARVSNPSNQNNKETAEKLISYLIRHKHWSPLEMASATLEVETTRDIARQFLRHRSFSFQEFSQRYADPNDLDDTFVLREARLQDTKNRQNSIDVNDVALTMKWNSMQSQVIRQAKEAYNWAIENGIAKEQARAVLPEGNTVSKLYANGTIRSWVHYIELRSANGTQKEHMELAKEIGKVISKIFTLEKEERMGRKISTYYSDHGKGHAEVHFDFKEEYAYIKYFDNNEKMFFIEDFPGKSLRYVHDAAENWALGIKKLEDVQSA